MKNLKSGDEVDIMGSIVLLDELTINKIAAGEVVDRPASIVKELVENSIDAKASEIIIEIKNGGISYIKIIDNGIGFASDDIQLAFERHATSKIRQETDLLKITSMGFRGEALASIAAVSKVVLVTKNKYENNGLKVSVQAGSIQSIEDVASVIGTKIEIRDVFFNVPARYKFLKKDYTEAGYIEDVIIRIALSNPNIAFKYINNGKVVIQTGANLTLKDTIYDIFGNEIYDNLISLDSEYNNVNVDGVIGLQTISRSTRMHQFTYINSRYIKDKVINSAIDKACQQKYPINKYPFIILNIKLDPYHIDVNVHPAKLEVKFDDENLIFQSVYNSVNSALVKYDKLTSPFSNIIDKTLSNVDTISPNLIKVDTIKEEKEIYNIKTQQFDFDQNSLKENNTTK
ncbi:MAG: DNA mismatch repair endonuclease MutL [Clostridia bacterium]